MGLKLTLGFTYIRVPVLDNRPTLKLYCQIFIGYLVLDMFNHRSIVFSHIGEQREVH